MKDQPKSPADQLAPLVGHIVSTYRDKDEETMVRLLSPIEDAAATQQASTRPGGLLQLAIACGDVSALVGSELPDHVRKDLMRVEALLFSAINVFEPACRLDRDKVGGAYYAHRGYVPQLWQEAAAAKDQAAQAN